MNADWRTYNAEVLRMLSIEMASRDAKAQALITNYVSPEELASPDATDERGNPDDQNRSVGRPAQLRRDWVRAGWPLPPRPTNPKEDT